MQADSQDMEFQKSKGWIKGYYILSNVNKRSDEPDLYLVTIFDHVTTPAEDVQREKEANAFLQQTTRQGMAASGQRATYRHIVRTCFSSNGLVEVITWERRALRGAPPFAINGECAPPTSRSASACSRPDGRMGQSDR